MNSQNDLDSLREWATPRQLEFIDAVQLHGSAQAASKSFGIHKDGVRKSLIRLQKRAVVQGWSPKHGMVRTVPEPFIVKGQSVLDKVDLVTGERRMLLQWTKTNIDQQKYLQLIKDAIAAFTEDVAPITAAAPVGNRETDIIPWINIGDAHLGMMAEESQSNCKFNMLIAERELCAGISTLIDEAGEHERCVIQDLGDFTHAENTRGETEASHHKLDMDGTYHSMITVYSRIMRFIVDKALSKFNHVDVIINQGNHSRKNDWWMAELLRVAYGHTGRVNVLDNSNVFIGYRMGRTLVVSHHSDKCKPGTLPSVVASDFAVDFGETVYRYVDVGHVHHSMRLKESGGVTVESFNTLAPSDLYAHNGGWRSRQSITLIERSRTYGEMRRSVLPVERVRDLIDAAMTAGGVPHYRPPEKRAFAV